MNQLVSQSTIQFVSQSVNILSVSQLVSQIISNSVSQLVNNQPVSQLTSQSVSQSSVDECFFSWTSLLSRPQPVILITALMTMTMKKLWCS